LHTDLKVSGPFRHTRPLLSGALTEKTCTNGERRKRYGMHLLQFCVEEPALSYFCKLGLGFDAWAQQGMVALPAYARLGRGPPHIHKSE
jgi:hypothetical protein